MLEDLSKMYVDIGYVLAGAGLKVVSIDATDGFAVTKGSDRTQPKEEEISKLILPVVSGYNVGIYMLPLFLPNDVKATYVGLIRVQELQ